MLLDLALHNLGGRRMVPDLVGPCVADLTALGWRGGYVQMRALAEGLRAG